MGTERSFQTLRYDAATAVCAATADDADAEAQAASTKTVVETEEGFSFDVAFWEGAIRFGGAEIFCGELSRIESQCVVPVVFCFRPAPSWDCRGKEYSEQAAAILTVAVTIDAQCGQICGGICYKYSDSIAEHFFVWSVVERVSSLSAQPAWFLFILIFGWGGSLLLSMLLMMTAALAMLTYDDDHDKDEAADEDDHDDAYIVLFLFCSSPPFSPSPPLD